MASWAQAIGEQAEIAIDRHIFHVDHVFRRHPDADPDLARVDQIPGHSVDDAELDRHPVGRHRDQLIGCAGLIVIDDNEELPRRQ